MTMSSIGLQALILEEGKRSKMYIDSNGHPTIGVGHLILSSEPHLKTAKLSDLEINQLLVKDLIRFELSVNNLSIQLKQNEFDSLVSLSFNIGHNGFASSYLAKYISLNLRNLWNFANIKEYFLNWYSHGLLTARRTREYEMFHLGKYRRF